MGFMLWEDLLLGRLLPSVSSTVTALVIVLLVIWLFRVRNPGTKHLLLHLPLIKGLIVLVRGVPAPMPGFEDRHRYGFQVYDPFSLLRIPDVAIHELVPKLERVYVAPTWDAAVAQAVFFMALGAAFGVLAYRWIGLTLYYRALLSRPAATREEMPTLHRIIGCLVAAFGVSYPRVILMDEVSLVPCTIGVRPPTIILPRRLAQELGEKQLEAVLAHELAHISRADGFWHWVTLLLRDLQAFNPLAHWLFRWLLVEREKDADQRAAAMTGRPKEMALALVEVSLWAKGVALRPAPGAMSFRENLMGGTAVVEERVRMLLAGPMVASRLRPLGLALLTVYLMLVRVYVHFSVLGHRISLE